MLKICSKCKQEKDISLFNKAKKTKDGYDWWCRDCKKDFYKDPINAEKKAISDKKYYADNLDKVKLYKAQWARENKEGIKIRYKKWYNENRDSIYKKEVENRANNINKQLEHAMRTRLNLALRGIGAKADRTFILIGCNTDELKAMLAEKFTDGMTWDNYGLYGWHVDHIIPCYYFDLTKEEDQRKCFHYSNLQPLWATDNLKKGKMVVKT
jgi:hypothetical protein